MIESKEDYQFYLKADEIALQIECRLRDYFIHEPWRYERLLRKLEYYLNCKKSIIWRPYTYFLYFKLKKFGAKIGLSIPPNVFGPGLSVAHFGTIIVNPLVRVGNNCRIHNCVHIATQAHSKGEPDKCPVIGNNVFIGPGVVIVGDITIADNIAIGANSFVNTSFLETGITIAGAPAKKISNKGFESYYFKATDIIKLKNEKK